MVSIFNFVASFRVTLSLVKNVGILGLSFRKLSQQSFDSEVCGGCHDVGIWKYCCEGWREGKIDWCISSGEGWYWIGVRHDEKSGLQLS